MFRRSREKAPKAPDPKPTDYIMCQPSLLEMVAGVTPDMADDLEEYRARNDVRTEYAKQQGVENVKDVDKSKISVCAAFIMEQQTEPCQFSERCRMRPTAKPPLDPMGPQIAEAIAEEAAEAATEAAAAPVSAPPFSDPEWTY